MFENWEVNLEEYITLNPSCLCQILPSHLYADSVAVLAWMLLYLYIIRYNKSFLSYFDKTNDTHFFVFKSRLVLKKSVINVEYFWKSLTSLCIAGFVLPFMQDGFCDKKTNIVYFVHLNSLI